MRNSQIQISTLGDAQVVLNGEVLLNKRRADALSYLEETVPTRLQRRMASLVNMCQDETKEKAVELFDQLNMFLDMWAWDDDDKPVECYRAIRFADKTTGGNGHE